MYSDDKSLKICTRCSLMLPIGLFSLVGGGSSVLRSRCKSCCVKGAQEYKKNLTPEKAASQLSREKIAKARTYSENKSYMLAMSAAWRLKNPSYGKQLAAKYREQFPEK